MMQSHAKQTAEQMQTEIRQALCLLQGFLASDSLDTFLGRLRCHLQCRLELFRIEWLPQELQNGKTVTVEDVRLGSRGSIAAHVKTHTEHGQDIVTE